MGLYSQAIFVKCSRELFWFVVIFHLPVPSLPKFSPRYAVFFSPFIVVSVMKHVSLASSVVTVASLHVYSSLLHGEELWRPDLGPEEIEGERTGRWTKFVKKVSNTAFLLLKTTHHWFPAILKYMRWCSGGWFIHPRWCDYSYSQQWFFFSMHQRKNGRLISKPLINVVN